MHLPLISSKRILLVHRLVDITRGVDCDRHTPTLHIDDFVRDSRCESRYCDRRGFPLHGPPELRRGQYSEIGCPVIRPRAFRGDV